MNKSEGSVELVLFKIMKPLQFSQNKEEAESLILIPQGIPTPRGTNAFRRLAVGSHVQVAAPNPVLTG